MTYLENITDAEEKAKQTIADAQKKADDTVLEAEKLANREVEEFLADLSEKERGRISLQKKELASLYGKITENGRGEASRLSANARTKIKKAAEFAISKIA